MTTKQREAMGIIRPESIRTAASLPLSSLVADYEADLKARELNPRHIEGTINRLRRVATEAAWKRLFDVRPESFLRWRANFGGSAKTKKEYQVSVNAFLNWLVRIEKLERNPLARLDMVETRGKEVRESRAFTEDELRRLLAVSKRRRIVYLLLLYTGQRKSEVKALRWIDLHLDENRPYILFRTGTMKDKEKRAVPLHPSLSAELVTLRGEKWQRDGLVFNRTFPTNHTLRADMVRAGIERMDDVGRVLHFHSFRKTFQTLGVMHGVNQRSAQEILGHSDANMTAKVYTDVPALALHGEIAKLPWLGDAHMNAQEFRFSVRERFKQVICAITELAEVAQKEGLAEKKLVDATGLEPDANSPETCLVTISCSNGKCANAHIDAHECRAVAAIMAMSGMGGAQ